MPTRIFASLIVFLILTSCVHNPLDVDLNKVNIASVPGERFEKDLFNISRNDIKKGTIELKNKYGSFFDHYMMNLLKVNNTSDSIYEARLIAFLNDKDIKGCYAQIKKVYPDEAMNELAPQVNDCIKRFHFHFPKRKLPVRFVTVTSGWNYAFAYTDSTLITSLDMYLGDTSIYYQMLQLPQFRTRCMNKNYVIPDMIRGWLVTEFDNAEPTNTLLYHTIFYGRIYYAVTALLPDIADTTLMCYTPKQMEYCKEYEKKLWGYFAEKNRLYETNMKTIQELTSDGPFSGAISKECPPRIAMWVGLQIVRSYMKNNEGATLEKLMEEKDAQKILNRSKYRP